MPAFDSPDALRIWLLLSLVPGIGPVRLKALLEPGASETPDTLWQRVSPDDRKAALASLPTLLEWQLQPGNHLIPLYAAAYPRLLATIADPPPVLYVRGQPELLELPQLAIVGTRKPTADGRRVAREFASRLARGGYLVTSGLAHGIDTDAHASALDAGGRSIAVLGSGLDRVYPKRNAALAARLATAGALVSEFLPWEGPREWHFPQRNRVISGLSHGVLVVEAASRSGSLITARLAADQGREVFAVPGSIYNPQARGCHALLRKGATLVESIEDIFAELSALAAWERQRLTARSVDDDADNPSTTPPCVALDPLVRTVLDAVGHATSLEQVVSDTGRAAEDVVGALAELELLGLVVPAPAGWSRAC